MLSLFLIFAEWQPTWYPCLLLCFSSFVDAISTFPGPAATVSGSLFQHFLHLVNVSQYLGCSTLLQLLILPKCPKGHRPVNSKPSADLNEPGWRCSILVCAGSIPCRSLHVSYMCLLFILAFPSLHAVAGYKWAQVSHHGAHVSMHCVAGCISCTLLHQPSP